MSGRDVDHETQAANRFTLLGSVFVSADVYSDLTNLYIGYLGHPKNYLVLCIE